MNGQADSTFGAVSIIPASRAQRRRASGYLLIVLFALFALACLKGGAYFGVPMSAAEAQPLNQVAVPGVATRPGEQTQPDFLEIQKRKYGQLAGLPVQILDNTGGFLHDSHLSKQGSQCIVALSTALIEQNDGHFRDTLRGCVQQARGACSAIPAPDNASDVRTEFAIRTIGAQCDAMRSQAVSIGL